MSKIWENFKALPAERKALCLFIPVIVLAMVFAWYSPSPSTPEREFTTPPSIAGTDVPKVDKPVKGGKVKVIPKDDVEDAVDDFPVELKPDNIQILNTAELPATESGYKVISSINTDTGEGKLLTRENQLPLFAFENKRKVGAGYGFSTEGTAANIYCEYGFLRVGAVHVGVRGEIKAVTLKAPEASATATVEYRW